MHVTKIYKIIVLTEKTFLLFKNSIIQ